MVLCDDAEGCIQAVESGKADVAAADRASLMDSRRLRFECRLDDGPDCILVDRLRFNQIFLNLLSNAAQYTPTGGQVSLVMEELPAGAGESHLRFTVRDTGVGMSEEFLQRIFEPFAQEKNDARSVYQGTGLGLPIVKSLIDAMGGTIAVESHLGQGTTFTVDLTVPLAEPVTAADPQQRPAGERPWGQAHPPGGGQRDQHLCG